MDVSTFEFLGSSLATFLQSHDTNMRYAVQIKVVAAIFRLATGNSMQSIANLYRVGLSTSQLAVSQFNKAVNTLLLKKFIRWPSTAVMDEFVDEFQNLHGIPYAVGAVDGSHIPIVAPRIHAADYFNRKGFHSILLQDVLSNKWFFWEFQHRLDKVNARIILRGGKPLVICFGWRCCISLSSVDAISIQEPQGWIVTRGVPLEFCSKLYAHVYRASVRYAQGQMAHSSRIDMHLKIVSELMSTCLVLYNICIIF